MQLAKGHCCAFVILATMWFYAQQIEAVIGIPFGNVKGAEKLEEAGEFAKALEAREITAEFCEYFSIPEFEDDLEFYRAQGHLRFVVYIEGMLAQFRGWAKLSREKAMENRTRASLDPEQELRYRKRIRRQLMGAADLYPEIHNGQLGLQVELLERNGVTSQALERAQEGRERTARLYEKVSIPYALHAIELARVDGDVEEVKQLEAKVELYRKRVAENRQKAKDNQARAAQLRVENRPERLRERLADPDKVVRGTAIDVAEALGLVEVLYAGLESDLADVRIRAFEALKRKLDIRGLLYAMFSDDADIVEQAKAALKRDHPLFRSVVIERCIDALNDDTPVVRENAYRKLLEYADELAAWRPDDPPSARQAAAEKWKAWLNTRLKPGLLGHYYRGQESDEVAATRVDAVIDLHWEEAPHPDVPKGRYVVRWIGKLRVPETQTYRLFTYNDDGVRVWINHRRVIDDWNQHTPAPQYGEIPLETGWHDIFIEFFNAMNDATLQLFWGTEIMPQTLIPADNLWHYDPAPVPEDAG